MSAWTVTNGHIDVLVSAALAAGLITADEAQQTGETLWTENYASVNARYREQEATPAYTPELATEAMHPAAVLNAVGCYEYQSCEHTGWTASAARQLCEAITAHLLTADPALAVAVPGEHYAAWENRTRPAYLGHPVYKAAPWGFESVTQAYASAFEGVSA